MKRAGSIRAVTFDVGGTLINPWPTVGHVYAEVAREVGAKGPSDPDRLNDQFTAAWKAKIRFDYSREAWAELVCRTFGGSEDEFGMHSPLFRRLYERFTEADAWRVYDDVRPALEALRARGLPLAVVSNWDERLRPLLRNLRLDLYFKVIVVSAEIGAHKPEPAVFEQAAVALEVGPEEILHVGDSAREDLEGARSAGLQSVLLRRPPAESLPGSIPSLIELLAMESLGR